MSKSLSSHHGPVQDNCRGPTWTQRAHCEAWLWRGTTPWSTQFSPKTTKQGKSSDPSSSSTRRITSTLSLDQNSCSKLGLTGCLWSYQYVRQVTSTRPRNLRSISRPFHAPNTSSMAIKWARYMRARPRVDSNRTLAVSPWLNYRLKCRGSNSQPYWA